jgi:hypothetical protein
VRLFVLGAPCAGRSAVAVRLRHRDVDVIDVEDEIQRLNGERGFAVALLDVSQGELRHSDRVRLAEEGWTNVPPEQAAVEVRQRLGVGAVDAPSSIAIQHQYPSSWFSIGPRCSMGGSRRWPSLG